MYMCTYVRLEVTELLKYLQGVDYTLSQFFLLKLMFKHITRQLIVTGLLHGP